MEKLLKTGAMEEDLKDIYPTIWTKMERDPARKVVILKPK